MATSWANAPLSAFHYCFRSKQELTTTVVNDLVREARQALQPGADLHDALHDGMRRLWSTAARHPDRQLVLYELGKWQYDCYFEAAVQFLEDLAAAAGRSGGCRFP
jgi:AcrR family transcriptional regulator